MTGAYHEQRSLTVVSGMLLLLAVTGLFIAHVQGQEDPGPVDPNKYDPNRQTGDDNQYNQNDIRNQPRITDRRLKYFMDSSTDCNRPVRTVSEGPITVNGRGATQPGATVVDCTLQLELQTPQTASRLKIELTNMDIRDCDVKFTIFDGASTQQKILNSFNCKSKDLSINQRVVFTSLRSNRVTFVLDRQSQQNLDYEIVVEVSVARSDPINPDSSPLDTDHRTWKFEQRYLVLIVGVCYVVLTAILVIVFIISCVNMPRKTPGAVWNEAQFSHAAYSNQALNTSAGSRPSNRGQPLTLGGWVKNGGLNAGMKIKPVHERNPIQVKKRIVMRSEDADSVFESDADIVKKKPPPYTDTDGEERRHIRTHNSNKPRATARDMNTSYTLADDDHPQDYYLQREIEVPVKQKKSKRRNQKRDMESSSSSSENEKLSSGTDTDAETEKTSLGVNNDPEVTDHAIQRDDNTDNDDSDDDDNEVANHMYAIPNKPVKQERQDKVQHPVPAPRTQTPDDPASRNHTPEPHPRPVNTVYQDRYAPAGDYPEYHPPPQQYYEPQQPRYAQRYPQHDASYDPVTPPSYNLSHGMAPRHQPANYAMPPPHQPANYGVDQAYRHPPPYATSTPPRHRRGPPPPQDNSYPQQANPKDPPVYSYLVQRGYNPVDTEGYSPASSATSHHSTDNRLGLNESGYSANLDSGVELMKRHTDV